MPKLAVEMGAQQIGQLKTPGIYAVGSVKGLHIVVTPKKAKCWILRIKVGERIGADGKARPIRREFGLGGYPEITLAAARDKARELRELVRKGIDPAEQRKAARLKLIRAQQANKTFREMALEVFRVKQSEFRNPKHAAQWISTLETHAFPSIGDMPINDVTTEDVFEILDPIWETTHETATRVRQRMQIVFAASMKGDNPIRSSPVNPADMIHFENRLASVKALKRKRGNKHHPALPVAEVPRLMADLARREAISAKALRFAILTASRSSEVRLATWSEFDLDARTWHLTAERMKADKPHSVPLSDEVVAILESLPRDNPAGLVFPSARGTELSDATLAKMLKDAHEADTKAGGAGYTDPKQDNRIATPHGTARSSFKDWTRQKGRFPDEWSELALAHINSDETRAAYARNELLEERRGMMQAWADYVTGLRVVGAV